MQSHTATWFETKIRYDKMMDNGLLKTITEQYVVEGLSFTEAEAQIIEEMATYITGDYRVTNIAQAAYKEVFFSSLEADDRWYKAKLQFITIDEDNQKEKRQNIYYLINAGDLPTAVKYIEEIMGKTMIDYTISSIAETAIIEVYMHHADHR